MSYVDPAIHPLYVRTLSKPIDPLTLDQLRQYCRTVEYGPDNEYLVSDRRWHYNGSFKIRMLGLRESSRTLIHIILEPYV